MCSSIREFGFKIPVLARGDGEVVDGHLRLKAARKLGITEVPVILCDEWTPAQVRAFRLMVNRSVSWAAWDEELLALELQELKESDFDLSLTGFDPGEIDGLLALEDDERANATPPLPENPVSRVGDLWVCGKHRVLCGDATSAEVAEDGRLMVRRIPRGTPAYEAGLDTGDEIVGFADFRVHPATWDRQLANYQPGDRLPLLLARRGRLVRITVTLGHEPALAWKLEAGTASPHRAVW